MAVKLARSSAFTVSTTRLRVPPLRPRNICRSRLIDRLALEPSTPAALIVGPAGSGKSTLVSQWVHATKRPSAWLSLEEDDSELNGFLSRLVAAIQLVLPSSLKQVKRSLEAGNPPLLSVISLEISNALDELESPLSIVLDDLHRVDEGAPLFTLLASLLKRMPHGVRLLLTSRTPPPLPLAHLRIYGLLIELGPNDLKLTEEEAQECIENSGLSLREDQRRRLVSLADGWVAGLRLALGLVPQGDCEHDFLRELESNKSQLRQYLAQEELARHPPTMREFMLRSALVGSFCVELLEVLFPEARRRGTSPQCFIDYLLQECAFAIPLDEDGHWFRYHHIFQSLLIATIQQERERSELSHFRAQAARWFEESDRIDLAIRQSILGKDWVGAAQIVERQRHEELDRDRWHVVASWLELLPQELRGSTPGLFLAEAWTAFFYTDIDRVAWCVETWEQRFSATERSSPPWSYEFEFLASSVAYWTGQAKLALEHVEAFEQLAPSSRSLLRGEAHVVRSLSQAMLGDSAQAVEHNEILLRESSDDHILCSRILAVQMYCRLIAGLPLATYRDAIELEDIARRYDLANTKAWAYYLQGSALLQAFDFHGACSQLKLAGQELYSFELRAAADALSALALAQQLECDGDAASATLKRLTSLADETHDTLVAQVARSATARVSCLAGNPESALSWAGRATPRIALDEFVFWFEVPALTQTRVWIEAGDAAALAGALSILEECAELTIKSHFHAHQVQVRVLQACAYYRQGNWKDACSALEIAIELAEPGGLLLPFFESAAPVRALLPLLDQARRDSAFCIRLTARLVLQAGHGDVARVGEVLCLPGAEKNEEDPKVSLQAVMALDEPLTMRELDVLLRLNRRLQNKEIAVSLNISPYTVNDHLKKLYRKLSAQSRREAVRKAFERGLFFY